MATWIWVLIPLVAIVGGYIIDYQKNKLKWQNQTSSNEKELEELRLLMQQMKKRIENLEAIATSDSELGSRDPLENIEIDPASSIKNENEKTVAQQAAKKEKEI